MPKKKEPRTYDEHLGRVIAGLAETRGKTQEQVAEAAMITLTTYGRRERGEIPFAASEVERIAYFLDEPAGAILERALRNYGGVKKLLSEARGTKTPSPTEGTVTSLPIRSRPESEQITPGTKAAHRIRKQRTEE